ncbi:MAG: hypothetical protein DRI92_06160 [Aquificota bacterium]|nr:MAG: hypothetical protein DRI92_06160 [Aquificota bacterium]
MRRKKRTQGKGDLMRPCNWKKYEENYERIFGKKKRNWREAKICPSCKGLGCEHCEDGVIYYEGRLS